VKKCFFVGLALAALSSIGLGQVIPIQNASFESPPVDPGVYTSNGVITDWTTYSPESGVWNPTGGSYFYGHGWDGNQVAYMNGAGSSVSQNLDTDVSAATTYTLSTLFGSRLDQFNGIGSFNLLAGSTIVASIYLNSEGNTGLWYSANTSWTSTAPYVGEDISVEYLLTSGNQLDVDAASLQAVPEPFTMTLGIAGVGLAVRRRILKAS
jgi:hypothetical protein